MRIMCPVESLRKTILDPAVFPGFIWRYPDAHKSVLNSFQEKSFGLPANRFLSLSILLILNISHLEK